MYTLVCPDFSVRYLHFNIIYTYALVEDGNGNRGIEANGGRRTACPQERCEKLNGLELAIGVKCSCLLMLLVDGLHEYL